MGRATHAKDENHTDYNRLMHRSSGKIDICEPENSAYAHLQDDSEVIIILSSLSTMHIPLLKYGISILWIYPCVILGTIILVVCMS